MHWHNTERLHRYLGDVPPAELEEMVYGEAIRSIIPDGNVEGSGVACGAPFEAHDGTTLINKGQYLGAHQLDLKQGAGHQGDSVHLAWHQS